MGTWQDPSLTEASGMAYSEKYADHAYTGNDENGPTHFVNLSTGKTEGKTSIKGHTLVDPEAFAMDANGNLYRCDCGDNDATRSSIYLYKVKEPGPGNRTINWTRYQLHYPDGAHNAETFVIWPNGNMDIVAKEANASVYRLPKPLKSGEMKKVYTRTDLDFLSDAVASRDGRWAFGLKQGQTSTIYVFDERWNQVDSFSMPSMTKPEGICIKKDGKGLWVCDDKGGTGGKFQQVKIPKAYWPVAKPYTPPPANTPPANPCMA